MLRQMFDVTSSTYTYLVADEKKHEALIIDPVRDHVGTYLTLLDELNLDLVSAFDTHTHADHITGTGTLRDVTGCDIAGSHKSDAKGITRPMHNGDQLQAGDYRLRYLDTPGHTDDSGCLYREGRPGWLFSGDTLMIRSSGRTDFQNGDSREEYHSLFDILLNLPESTKVYPAHDYRGMTESTIGEEKRYNPRLQVKSEDGFVNLLDQLNLAKPKKMEHAIPVNLRCGRDK